MLSWQASSHGSSAPIACSRIPRSNRDLLHIIKERRAKCGDEWWLYVKADFYLSTMHQRGLSLKCPTLLAHPQTYATSTPLCAWRGALQKLACHLSRHGKDIFQYGTALWSSQDHFAAVLLMVVFQPPVVPVASSKCWDRVCVRGCACMHLWWVGEYCVKLKHAVDVT